MTDVEVNNETIPPANAKNGSKRKIPQGPEARIDLLGCVIVPTVHKTLVDLEQKGKESTSLRLGKLAGDHINEISNVMAATIVDTVALLVQRRGNRQIKASDVTNAITLLCEPEMVKRITETNTHLIETYHQNTKK